MEQRGIDEIHDFLSDVYEGIYIDDGSTAMELHPTELFIRHVSPVFSRSHRVGRIRGWEES
jgi:hypothetical protein